MKFLLLCFLTFATVYARDSELGRVEKFKVSEFGTGYVELTWTYIEGTADYPLHKYSLTIDSDLTSQFKCTQSICSKTIEDLEACIEHVFELTPVFYAPGGGDIDGDVFTTTGYTTDEIPGSVTDITVTADNDKGISLKWNQTPLHAGCVSEYEVCFRLDGESDSLCSMTSTTDISVTALSACGLYHVIVTPITPSNKRGPTVEEIINTHDGVPGKPMDVQVGLITQETIQLLWNNPSHNPLCLERFQITIGEAHTKMLRPSTKKAGAFDNEFTFSPLDPCTNYTIDICSANAAEEISEKVIKHASTDETNPLSPPSVTATPNGMDSIIVNWGDNENDRCSGSFIVCWNDGIHPIEQCQEVDGDGDNELVIHDLSPCSSYDISVSVQSPNGTYVSNSTGNSSSTADVRPGPVIDLHVLSVDTDKLTIQCQPPKIDPQCVKEIITRVIDEDQRSLHAEKVSHYEETISGLQPCTNYRVLVTTKSPNGLQSVAQETKATTLVDRPSEPRNFEATDITTNSISLQWFQPENNPRCASEYNLVRTLGSVNVTTVINSSAFKILHTEKDLDACTDYLFTLSAASSVGGSSEITLIETTSC